MRYKEPPSLTSYVDVKGNLVLSPETATEDTSLYRPDIRRKRTWPIFLAGLLLGIAVMAAILWWKGAI
jgi:hypothetical protein